MIKNIWGLATAVALGIASISPCTANAAIYDPELSSEVLNNESGNILETSLNEDLIDSMSRQKPESVSPKGIYGKKYKIIQTTDFYEGPGTNYAVVGTYYKNNYVSIFLEKLSEYASKAGV